MITPDDTTHYRRQYFLTTLSFLLIDNAHDVSMTHHHVACKLFLHIDTRFVLLKPFTNCLLFLQACLQVKHERNQVTTDICRIIRKNTNDSDCRNCVGKSRNCRQFEKGLMEIIIQAITICKMSIKL